MRITLPPSRPVPQASLLEAECVILAGYARAGNRSAMWPKAEKYLEEWFKMLHSVRKWRQLTPGRVRLELSYERGKARFIKGLRAGARFIV